ncbi:MAG: CRISPR-associated endonuclease Cas2 [Deltaproteobacteria bacterium]|nr:CRISPR-associated endonuclease Cas2 [Deltaproteobacteria bacterium]RLB91123.1 MAG: CRISPR-associated endonuclease Cas2 [Deltaproteobacteria bacterium]RLC09797.1 MAG: CRISPR-associated endonuclease Cas2 [Deltaproteobacteria bacterium]
MTQKVQHIVASYDIHDPGRLAKVAKIMVNYGERVLKSVFECNLTDGTFQEMKSEVDAIIDHMEDSVRYYFICDKCLANIEYSGLGLPFVEDEDVIIT